MKRAPRSRQRHDLYAKYHDYDSEISDLLGECGFRWHARAHCPRSSTFKDFVLSRITDTRLSKPADARPSGDSEWEEQVELQIAPHPALSAGQRKAIELDYGMERGVTTIPVRRALLYYALKRLGLDTDPAARSPQDQQIVLLNREAIHADH